MATTGYTAMIEKTNLQRLKDTLKKDSLAARLVDAQMSAKTSGQQAALKKVIADRLDELRKRQVRVSADRPHGAS